MGNNLIIALIITGKGMLGIFVVIGLISLSITLIGRLGAGKDDK